MKRLIVLTLLAVLASAPAIYAQGTQMYDNSYTGPRNFYGVPQYKTMQRAQQPTQNQHYFASPLINKLQGVGSYLWGFAPAPLRGSSPAQQIPTSGDVIINYVPPSQ